MYFVIDFNCRHLVDLPSSVLIRCSPARRWPGRSASCPSGSWCTGDRSYRKVREPGKQRLGWKTYTYFGWSWTWKTNIWLKNKQLNLFYILDDLEPENLMVIWLLVCRSVLYDIYLKWCVVGLGKLIIIFLNTFEWKRVCPQSRVNDRELKSSFVQREHIIKSLFT